MARLKILLVYLFVSTYMGFEWAVRDFVSAAVIYW